MVLIPVGISVFPAGIVLVGVLDAASHFCVRLAVGVGDVVVLRFDAGSACGKDDIVNEAGNLVLECLLDLAEDNLVVAFGMVVVSVHNLDTVSSVHPGLVLGVSQAVGLNPGAVQTRTALVIEDGDLGGNVAAHAHITPILRKGRIELVCVSLDRSELDAHLFNRIGRGFQRAHQQNFRFCHFKNSSLIIQGKSTPAYCKM